MQKCRNFQSQDALAKKGADIKLVSDSLDAVKIIAARSVKGSLPFKILIEVDSGEGRAGILAELRNRPAIP